MESFLYVWIECYPSSEEEESGSMESGQEKIYYREILIMKQKASR